MDVQYATKGKADAALATGIIGTVGTGLGLLAGGNGLFGCGANNMSNVIAEKDMEIAYLKSRDAAKSDSLELYRYVDERFNRVEQQLAQQAVVNAQITANLSCMQQTLNTLNGLTKTVIPIGNVCPAPMPQYNSWTAPTAEADAGAGA